PKDASVTLGPDATGVGWVYQYALTSTTLNLADMRSYQDYFLRFGLLSVPGVSEVASVGGFVKNYEITADQNALVNYNLSILDISNAIEKTNVSDGARVVLRNGFENMVQTSGYYANEEEILNTPLLANNGLSLSIRDVASVNLTPSERRGVADLNGEGETVGGIVIARIGENAYKVIADVKEKLKTLTGPDVTIVPVYDRSELIEKAVDTLKRALIEEAIAVAIIVAIFLGHTGSIAVIVLTLPLTIGLTFLAMTSFGMSSNIMSLGGIAIAIGAMVDASIVLVENAHKHIIEKRKQGLALTYAIKLDAILESSKQVGRPIFFALMLVIVSFMPIFALTGQEGALFSPMAFTKSFAMLFGAIIAITLTPALMSIFLNDKIKAEEDSRINSFFIKHYETLLRKIMGYKKTALILFIGTMVLSYPLYNTLKWEFMPKLSEEVFMYMPVAPMGISVDLASSITQKTDQIIKKFPEVQTVFGKAGRADTATDSAPLAMIETIITLKPKDQWRAGMSEEKLMEEMDKALQIEGLSNSWTYPIRGRIDMLITGIRTPLGIKVYGQNFEDIEKYSNEISKALNKVEGSSAVFAEKAATGYYLDIKPKDDMIAQYGLNRDEIFKTIALSVGGSSVSTMIQGTHRYPISVRLDASARGDIEAIKNILIKTELGQHVLSDFADISYIEAPGEIKTEKALPVGYIYIMPKETITPSEYKQVAQKVIETINVPQGIRYEWTGQSEYLESAKKTLILIAPISLLLTFMLIFASIRDIRLTALVFFTLPFSFVGGLLAVKLLGFSMSIAVIVGFLALLGVAAETAIVMLIYLKEAVDEKRVEGKREYVSLLNACIDGAAKRIRPKLMTVFSLMAGLMPLLYIKGVGSEIMGRIAAPMLGGLITSTLLTLILIPIFYLWIVKKEFLKDEKPKP
ncbi:CusA/CzcA family heavy metal efflux RND transporter, partial [Sulfuricurvum sp. RIFCSPLOWO2_12_FULL_43_24]|uniref:efflux RND transporter permease subunit n=1 Tax=Sulfuricurvum sp. RIFCSPLOWO2_12_FULL_43_24 TaxID=1802247 RepID=UPI0008C854C8